MISRSVNMECKWCLKYKGYKSLNVMQSEGDCKGRRGNTTEDRECQAEAFGPYAVAGWGYQ